MISNIGQASMDSLFLLSGVFYRSCANCVTSHQSIYYRRITPFPTGFSLYVNIITQWLSTSNVLNVDFYLYSSWSDLQNDVNRWQYCNYADGVGFPRDCGPTGMVSDQWTPRLELGTLSFNVLSVTPTCPCSAGYYRNINYICTGIL